MKIGFYIFLLLISFQSFSENLKTNTPEFNSDSLIIDSVTDQSKYIINNIVLKGNKKTKDYIIFRELEFKVNDTLSLHQLSTLIKESRENLLNISLFNFVTIDTTSILANDFYRINITISVIERWYIWPWPLLEFADRNFNTWWKTKDFNKINYGMFLVWDNFRGRMEQLKILVRLGYEEKFGLFYEIPYINKKQTIGLALGVSYGRNHEVSVNTIDDNIEYYKDEESYPQQKFISYIQLINRPDIHNTHMFYLGYNQYLFGDTLLKINPLYSVDNKTDVKFLSFYYKYISDYRDYKPYPLNGYYFDIEFNKQGFRMFQPNGLDISFVNSKFNIYKKLFNRFYFASGLAAKFSSKSFQPYFLQRGLGYGNDYIRGYEFYVIDGQNYGLLKTNLKFELLPTKILKFNFIKTEKFNIIHYAIYLNLFIDLGYVYDDEFYQNNTLSNSFQYGTGIGIDFVTYYDIVIRFEYSMNKMKETGFFIHFKASI